MHVFYKAEKILLIKYVGWSYRYGYEYRPKRQEYRTRSVLKLIPSQILIDRYKVNFRPISYCFCDYSLCIISEKFTIFYIDELFWMSAS